MEMKLKQIQVLLKNGDVNILTNTKDGMMKKRYLLELMPMEDILYVENVYSRSRGKNKKILINGNGYLCLQPQNRSNYTSQR